MLLLVISIIYFKDFINLRIIYYLIISIIFFIFIFMMLNDIYLKRYKFYNKNKYKIIILLIIDLIVLLCMIPE